MLTITDVNHRTHYVSPRAVALITDTGLSSQNRGIRAHVHLFDGKVIEAQQTARELASRVAEAQSQDVHKNA